MLNIFPLHVTCQRKEKNDEVNTEDQKRNNPDWHYSNILIEHKTQEIIVLSEEAPENTFQNKYVVGIS